MLDPSKPSPRLEPILYDAFMVAEEPGDVEFFASMLDSQPGLALELGCGTGRVLLQLLEQGYPVEGLDSDAQMLATAKSRAQARALQVELHHANMEEFKPQKRYTCLYSPGFSFQLLRDKTQALNALQSWQNWLPEGGKILLTCYWPWEASQELSETDWELYNSLEGEFLKHWLQSAKHPLAEQATQARCYTRSELELASQHLTRFHRYELLDNQGQILAKDESALAQIYWSPEELLQSVQALGFEQPKLYSGFSTHPLEEGDNLWTLSLISNRTN